MREKKKKPSRHFSAFVRSGPSGGAVKLEALPPVVCYHTHTRTHTDCTRLEHNKRVSSPRQCWVIASTGVEPLRGLRAARGGAAVVVVA